MKAPRPSRAAPAPASEVVGSPEVRRPVHDEPATVDLKKVSERARALWRERGCPMGRDEEIWLEAERQLSGVGRRLGKSGAGKPEAGASSGGRGASVIGL
ncbi:MAG: DUF2934 domain-containing protein [Burkholderiales bacterium]|nr:DUF2934 domain-containing protein [Opitutaceae bacterium]